MHMIGWVLSSDIVGPKPSRSAFSILILRLELTTSSIMPNYSAFYLVCLVPDLDRFG
jgi:hypothetical protein